MGFLRSDLSEVSDKQGYIERERERWYQRLRRRGERKRQSKVRGVQEKERKEESVRRIMQGGKQVVVARKEWSKVEVARRIARGGWRKGQGGECKCVIMRVQGGKRKEGILH
jgi:nitrogen fixation/metabolism regulation signal transduction histidine kinase